MFLKKYIIKIKKKNLNKKTKKKIVLTYVYIKKLVRYKKEIFACALLWKWENIIYLQFKNFDFNKKIKIINNKKKYT